MLRCSDTPKPVRMGYSTSILWLSGSASGNHSPAKHRKAGDPGIWRYEDDEISKLFAAAPLADDEQSCPENLLVKSLKRGLETYVRVPLAAYRRSDA